MRRIVFLLCLLVARQQVHAQQLYFLYLQTEGRQPFYVKLDKKLYNSSVSGYLIIPKLREGTYSLVVGFPKSEWEEQRIPIVIQQKSAGYLLKNFGARGWGLFNWQTLDVAMAENSASKNPEGSPGNATAFSTMLSDAVNDPTIKQAPVVSVPPGKPSPAPSNVPPAATPVPEKKEPSEPVQVAEPEVNRSQVSRTLLVSTDSTVEAIYIIQTGEVRDTVIVNWISVNSVAPRELPAGSSASSDPLVSAPPPVKVTEPVASGEGSGVNPDTVQSPKKETVPETTITAPEKKTDTVQLQPVADSTKKADQFIPMELSTKAAQVENPMDTAVKAPDKGQLQINSNCRAEASEEDFLKLRKKMAGEKDDEAMLNACKKMFRQKCFSTDQIKHLSVLFMTDQGKYSFFDMAYPFVYDSMNFPDLQSQLTDPYYISRFRAMIRQ